MAVKEEKQVVIEQFHEELIPSCRTFVEPEEDQKLIVELNQLIDEDYSFDHSMKAKKLDRPKKDRRDHLIRYTVYTNVLIHQQINR